jgi:uncharacterized protein (TIGR03435 family)
LRAKNTTVRTLIEWAYTIEPFRLVGGPKWVSGDRFDIQAKDPESDKYVSYDETQQMMRSLLEDRFKLAVHHETRESPAYFLVVSKAGIKAPETPDHSCYMVTRSSTPADIGNQPICGAMRGRSGHMEGKRISTEILAKNLERVLGGVVFDRTDLGKHFFDVSLTWMPMKGLNLDRPELPNNPAPLTTDTLALPSIFTALREQLGLEIKSHKAPVDVLVIDHVEYPTPN